MLKNQGIIRALMVSGALCAWGTAQAGVRVLTDNNNGMNATMPVTGAVRPIAAPPSDTTMAQQTVTQTPAAQSTNGAAAPAGTPGTPIPDGSNASGNQTASQDGLPPLPEGKAFHDTLNAAMPLTSGQIAELREAINANRRAQEAPLSPAMPRIETINARIGVGAPPSVSVQSGYVSTINVVDAYGRPWPIVRFSVGNPKAFNVSVAGNSAAVSDLQPYAQSDLALYLRGESVPLMVALLPGVQGTSGGGIVDYAVRLRVNAAEPGLPTPAGGVMGGANYTNALLSLVQGVAPAGARSLHVLGDPARVSAWTWESPRGKRLLLRAPATVIAPAWIATMQGPAGIHAWVLPDVKVVTVSRHGQPETITLQRYQWEGKHHG